MNNLIALSENIPLAGAIVWWRLTGNVSASRLAVEVGRQGLSDKFVPSPVSPKTALRRAVHEIAEKHLLVRPLGKGDGYAIVRESIVNEELEYETAAKVSLGANERPRTTELAGYFCAAKVEREFDAAIGALSPVDVSAWLIKTADRLDAIALRDTGGIYFVPKHTVEDWGRVIAALAACSTHGVFSVPALRSDQAVEAILDALSGEAESVATQLSNEVVETEPGKRACDSKIRACEAMKAKISRYEDLLGRKLDTLQERMTEVRGMIVAAGLKAAASKDEPQAELYT